ncbi:MAG: hypothetical protein WAK60_01190 [Sedimentisphaerales bacterium]
MSIVFHCEHCGRKIEAPDSAGGKFGKCPGCQNKVYVPSGQPEEELRLAPLESDDAIKQRKMAIELARLRAEILSETEVPNEGMPPKKTPESKPETLSDAELTTSIIGYLRLIADGELEEAGKAAKTIIPNGIKAVKILERIALSGVPEPELADIPQQVLSRLIKDLRSKFH